MWLTLDSKLQKGWAPVSWNSHGGLPRILLGPRARERGVTSGWRHSLPNPLLKRLRGRAGVWLTMCRHRGSYAFGNLWVSLEEYFIAFIIVWVCLGNECPPSILPPAFLSPTWLPPPPVNVAHKLFNTLPLVAIKKKVYLLKGKWQNVSVSMQPYLYLYLSLCFVH